MVTLFDVPVKLKDASVPWTSTGVTLAAGEYAYLIPEGSVSFTLNDIGWANCVVVFYWYCEKKGGSAGPYGGVGGPSGGHDGHLRLFYRVNGAGSPSQILASAAVAKGPGTIEVSRAGSDAYWDFSGKQTVQIWRMRGAQPPPCAAAAATCQQEPRIKDGGGTRGSPRQPEFPCRRPGGSSKPRRSRGGGAPGRPDRSIGCHGGRVAGTPEARG